MNGAEYAWSVLQRNNLQLESLLEVAHCFMVFREIGKSQVAFMYAQRHASSYDSLIYIDASQSESFIDAVAGVARNSDFQRLRVYANEPCMIGRSYLHAAQQIQGCSVPYEEVESLLKHALEFLDLEDEACRFPRYDALDQLAYCANRECEDLVFREGEDTPRVMALRAVVRNAMNEAFALDPTSCLDRFQGDEELFRECADEGVYYR